MALNKLRPAPRAPSQATLSVLETALSSLRLTPRTSTPTNTTSIRHASHKAQGVANGAKDGPGKRLGAKKTGGEYVVPGNILFKQRGTHWFPGDNCMMGRDHTIHAAAPGYVRYYRDPARHPDRRFIGIVFEKGQSLPQPHHAVRRRRLGMLAYEMPEVVAEQASGDLVTGPETGLEGNAGMGAPQPSTIREVPNGDRGVKVLKSKKSGETVETTLTLRPGYQYRQANWEIGRAAERSKEALKVRPFKPGDRFTAWRKRNVRIAKNAEAKQMRRGGKKKAIKA
ncbi:hypothetical protein MBLNU230_g4772t1 [Neophaeotheca triangularis]